MPRFLPSHSGVKDDAYDTLSFGRMPGKRRKSGGLNIRLSRMLLRLNTSLVADASTLGPNRPRNPSNGSSSSTIVSETTPQTPIDSIHNSVKSNSLGDGFAIIKAGSSPDKCRTSFFTNSDFPSWRDVDKQNKEEKNHQRELPGWLSQTFSTLEPDHPLHALAYTGNSCSTYDESDVSTNQVSSAPTGLSHHEETSNGTVFAFAPPINHCVKHEDRQNMSSAKRDSDFALSAYANTTKETSLGPPATGLYDLPAGDTYEETQSNAAEFDRLAQPGPFVQKSVHFLTPVRGYPSSYFTEESDQSHTPSNLLPTNDGHYNVLTYNPFSTPGPAASFSLASFDHAVADPSSVQDRNSDSLTFADDARPEDDVFAYSPIDEDTSGSVLSFTNSELTHEKPFSTPGPVYCPQPMEHYYSPSQEPSFSDHASFTYDDYPLDALQLSSCGKQIETQKTLRFIAREHEGMTKGFRASASVNARIIPTEEDQSQDRPFNIEDVLPLHQPDRVHDAFGSDAKQGSPMPHEDELDADAPAAIELFSSPPYIRFKHTKVREDNANCSLPKSSSRNDPLKAFASPYMRFDQLPTRTESACQRPDGTPALLHTPPRSQSLQKETEMYSLSGDEKNNSKLLNKITTVEVQTPGPRRESETPKEPKRRRAFAPCPGIYLSPIRDPEASGGVQRSLAKLETNGKFDDGMWHISPSQLSDDSIEEWET